MKIKFMMASSIFLLIMSGLLTVYPAEFETLTGLDTSGVKTLNFSSSGLNQDDIVESENRVCPALNTLNQSNIIEKDGGISKNTSSSVGWIQVNTSDVNRLYWNQSGQGLYDLFFGGKFLVLELSDNSSRGIGDTEPGTGYEDLNGNIDWANFSIYSDNAILYDIYSKCEVDSGEKQGNAFLNNPIINLLSSFFGTVLDFFNIVFSLIVNIFELLTLGGNEVSTWLLRIVLIPQVIGWLYVIVDGVGEFFG